MNPIIIYHTTGAIFSTIDEGENGRGCMMESGEPNLPELYGQINTVKPLGVRGCSNFPEWLKSRKDRNCSTFMFSDQSDKFTLRHFNKQRKESEEIVIKAWCGEDKKDEFEGVLFDNCLAKPKHQAWNPWYRNVDGVRGWFSMNQKTTEIRRAYIDEKLSLWIPLIKNGYKIKIRVANEPPKEAIPAVTDSLDYLIPKLKAAGLNPYKILAPGVQRIPEAEQTYHKPYSRYKRDWRKKRPDEMDCEKMRDTVHKYPVSSYGKMILEDNQNVPGGPAINMSLDGIYFKKDGKEFYPDAEKTYGYFYPLFRKIKDVGRKYKKILKNGWIIEVLGWGTNFKGDNVRGIDRAWREVFGESLARPDFKPLAIPEPEPKKPEPEPKEPEQPTKPVTKPIKEVEVKNFFQKSWAYLMEHPKVSFYILGILTLPVVWLLIKIL